MAAITVPPTLTLPHKGGGDKYSAHKIIPSPLRGEGWGGGGVSAGLHSLGLF